VTAAATPPLSPADAAPSLSAARRRRRWEVWRSPAGQPAWARPLLLTIAGLAAVLYAWNITNAGLAPYYAVAVKSMSESWRAFFYGGYDPAATITIDKLAGSFLPQALSVRLFGFHPWSMALPQVLEGVLAVLVLYRAVRQWAGVASAIVAALLFALTPIATSMFGHSMEDGALILCLVLAADAWQRAVSTGRLRSLVWSGVWVGLGFQAKMLEAWLILPALFVGYLVAAPPRLLTRLWQLAVAGLVMAAVSLSWILLFTVTPAADRPYVDGSTDNSAFAMVFGYNGVERLGFSFPGAIGSGPGIAGVAGGAGGAAALLGQPAGPVKLLSDAYGPQAGWLYPLAVLALVVAARLTVRTRRADPVWGGFLMWGTWLGTVGLVFSVMGTIPHTAYLAALAPPVAALSAAGIEMLIRLYRAGHPVGWLMPVAVLGEVAWAALLWRDYLGFLPWALLVASAAGAVSAAVLVRAWVAGRQRAPAAGVALAVGVAAMIAAPATWAASVLDAKYAGTSFDATAGPATGHGLFDSLRGSAVLADGFGATETLNPVEVAFYRYVTARENGADYLLAIPSWTETSRYILSTGRETLPLGGFSGTVPTPTLDRVRDLVRTGQLRFFLLGWFGGPGFGGADDNAGTVGAIESWVRKSCTDVPPQDFGSPPQEFGEFGGFGEPTLYDCGSA
jgi:4-amino-4-deoxy-L-arabinose transferase-like glycosyltransferase